MAEQYGNAVVALLSGLRRGSFLEDAAEELEEVLAAVRESGKKGELTIRIAFKPLTSGGALEITDTIAAKRPAPDVGTTLMYFTSEGGLSRRDPRQPELPGIVESGREAETA